jgi:hypothetical protein
VLRRNRNRPPRRAGRDRYPGLSSPRSLVRLALSGGGHRRSAFRGRCLGCRSPDPRGGRAAGGRETKRRAAPAELAAGLRGPVGAQVAAAASSAIDLAEFQAARTLLACRVRQRQAQHQRNAPAGNGAGQRHPARTIRALTTCQRHCRTHTPEPPARRPQRDSVVRPRTYQGDRRAAKAHSCR